MNIDKTLYKSGCKHFLGYIPCKPHKSHGVHCDGCEYYKKSTGKILIIKLGAIGDVIRTTPLLEKLSKEYPDKQIWWLTYSPAVVPSSVDNILKFTSETQLVLEETEFDILINLDKDPQACALTNRIIANKKYGYELKEGRPAPINELAKHKYLTGLFDDLNKENQKSYVEEIYDICGWEFSGEDYILEVDKYDWSLNNDGKKIIGLNTGCGARWVSRLWGDEKWVELIKKLQDEGYYPLLLGGDQEHEKNLLYEEKTGAKYLGTFPLKQFISLVDQCDVVVSAVTMGMHIAIGLHKELVLMNNIFNPAEFEMYGRGEIVQPNKECHCYFSPKCKNDEYFCMDHLPSEKIFQAVKSRIDK